MCIAPLPDRREIPATRFADPDPFHELKFPTALAAMRANAEFLGTPLAKLTAAKHEEINAIVAETLDKKLVIARVRDCMNQPGSTGNAG
jgi:hypothetical protein